MESRERIRRALERQIKVLTARPNSGRSSGQLTVRLRDGLACEIEGGNWHIIGDQPAVHGGTDQGPGPGQLGRAALGLCLAQGYQMALAKRGMSAKYLSVTVASYIDTRGSLGLADDVAPGYQKVECTVEIECDGDEREINAALDEADRLSPWLYNFTNAIEVRRKVTLR